MKLLILYFAIICTYGAYSQSTTILPSGITPNNNYPRLKYDDIISIPSPSVGDIAYDLTFLCLRVYNGSKWLCTYQKPFDSSLNHGIISKGGSANWDESGFSVTTDLQGNIIITGLFTNSSMFGNVNLVSNGEADMFIAKYNSKGDLMWAKKGGGISEDVGRALVTDSNGNIYVTGHFKNIATFESLTLTSNGGSDIFIAKYSSNGDLVWIKSAGGVGNDSGKGICIDSNGNVYITGYFYGGATFNTNIISAIGNDDVFVAKYDNDGQFQGVISGGSTIYDEGTDIAIDSNGIIYVTGFFQGTAFFGSNIITSSNGSVDIFLLKIQPTFNYVYSIKTFGGTGNDYSSSLKIDNNNNLFLTGSFKNTATFDYLSVTSSGYNDVFIAKFTNWIVEWVRKGGGSFDDVGKGIYFDSDGNIYVTGSYQGNAIFSNITLKAGTDQNIFVLKYDGLGSLLWAERAGGPLDDDSFGIAIDTNKNIYVTGYFQGNATWGTTNSISSGGKDFYISRINEQ